MEVLSTHGPGPDHAVVRGWLGSEEAPSWSLSHPESDDGGSAVRAPDGEELRVIVLQGARERVDFLSFSPDSRALVASRLEGAQLWSDLTAGGPPSVVLACPSVGSVRFTPDGR